MDSRVSLGDRYELGEPVGMGHCAEVIGAVDRASGRSVAIKRWFQRLGGPQDELQFRREVRAMEHVEHRAVVDVLDAGVDAKGRPFLVMELLEGESLRERLGRGALSADEAAEIFAELLDALAAVHAAGFIHRDLKPGNVFLSKIQPRVRLLDFGLARRTVRTFPNLSVQGFQTGTLPYMAPELVSASGEEGPASDVWSIGVMLYEALTGRRPFVGATLDELGGAIRDGSFVPIAQLASHVPVELSALVNICLQREAEDRFADASALLRALAGLRQGQLSAYMPTTAAGQQITMPQPVAEPPPLVHPTAERFGGPSSARGDLSVVAPPRPGPAPRKSVSWVWPIGLAALGVVVVVCGAFAFAGVVGASIFASLPEGGLGPGFGSPRVGRGGGTSSAVFSWLGPYPPALVDINGDGYLDAIGFSWDHRGTDGVAAVSGADASVLWVHEAEQDWGGEFEDVMVVVPNTETVVLVDLRGRAIGIDTRDGSRRWITELGGHGRQACVVDPTHLLVGMSDQFWYRVSIVDGGSERARPPDGCEAIPRVSQDRLSLMRMMPGWNDDERPSPLPWPRAEVRQVWQSPEQDRYVAMLRRPDAMGRDVIELAVLDADGAVRWQVAAASDPDLAQNWGLRHLTVQGDTLFAVYDMRGSDPPRRVAAFDLATGRRQWDAPLEWRSNFDFLRADEHRVWVGHWALEILDRADGHQIGRVGVFPNEHR